MLASLVVLGFMVVVFAALGVYYMKGNGVEMINMPAKRKAEWDKRELCRLIGRFLFFMAFVFFLLMAGIYFRARYLEIAGLILLPVSVLYVIIRVLTPKKSKETK